MILMALDHVRYYFTDRQFSPEDLDKTTLILFLTRWVTHYCAPAFFFLAGVAASLGGASRRRLVTRGLMLVALELTIVGFAWTFNPGYSIGGVIWSLGWSMVILAALTWLPNAAIAAFGLILIFAHDLFPTDGGPIVTLLHGIGVIQVGPIPWFVLYAIVPWCGVMAAGYAIAALYRADEEKRRRMLLTIGTVATVLFVLLRLTNLYGNPWPFAPRDSVSITIAAFLNVAKYPPSLQFLLMTLGPTLIALALLDRVREPRGIGQVIRVFGRVPLFFYVLHLFAIHGLALVVALISGQPWQWLGWGGRFPRQPPDGYGYGLPIVYAVWILIVIALYFPCRWYGRRKTRIRHAVPLAQGAAA